MLKSYSGSHFLLHNDGKRCPARAGFFVRSVPMKKGGGPSPTALAFSCNGRQPTAPWQCLYFLPEPQGHSALRLMFMAA